MRWKNNHDVHLSLTQLHFISSNYSSKGSFGPAAEEHLDRVCQGYRIHAYVVEWEAHAWIHRCLSFTFMRGMTDQFVGRRLVSFG